MPHEVEKSNPNDPVDVASRVNHPGGDEYVLGPDSLMWEMMDSRLFVPIIGLVRDGVLNALFPHFAVAFVEHDTGMTDVVARWRHTISAIVAVMFGTKMEAQEARKWVALAHSRVNGYDPVTSRNYDATEDDQVILTHMIVMPCMLKVYETYVRPLTPAQRDQFMREAALVTSQLVGISVDRLPTTFAEAEAYTEHVRPQMCITRSARTVLNILTDKNPPATVVSNPLVKVTVGPMWRAVIDLAVETLDPQEFALLGLRRPAQLRSRALVKLSGQALARMLALPPIRDRLERYMLGPDAQAIMVRARQARNHVAA